MFLIKSGAGCLLKYLDFNLPDILADPLVKDVAKKSAPSIRLYSTVADAKLSVWLQFDQG